MFATGVFRLEGSQIWTIQKFHGQELYDDDVISWIEKENRDIMMGVDGYVSNEGDAATVHIKERLVGRVESIKRTFRLNENEGVSQVIIKSFSGFEFDSEGSKD